MGGLGHNYVPLAKKSVLTIGKNRKTRIAPLFVSNSYNGQKKFDPSDLMES